MHVVKSLIDPQMRMECEADATFWTSTPWLLQIHDNYLIRFLGASFVWPATFLYFLSLRYLGSNYSPCYDSHLPYRIITSGPYRYIRHPMYLGKLVVGVGTFFLSGSLWCLPLIVWLAFEIIRTVLREESYLMNGQSAYSEYKKGTRMFVPFVI
jgi:protein-S-isoprenylcysteine O-methyltransferase Ste14